MDLFNGAAFTKQMQDAENKRKVQEYILSQQNIAKSQITQPVNNLSTIFNLTNKPPKQQGTTSSISPQQPMNNLSAISSVLNATPQANTQPTNAQTTKPSNITPLPNTQPQTTLQPDIQSNINSMYDNSLKSTLTALKQKIADSIGKQSQVIQNAPAQFTEAKNQTQTDAFTALQSLKENLANSGNSNSGYGRQGELNIQTSTSNNLNNINLAQNKIISDANAEIARLQGEGNSVEAQAVSDNAMQRLQSLIGQQNTDRTFNAQQEQNKFTNNMTEAGLTGKYNGIDTMAKQQNDLSLQGMSLNNQLMSIQAQFAPQIQQGQIDNVALGNEYQKMVNAGYPSSQAANIAATLAGTALTQANTAGQNLQNLYAPEIAAGQINGQKLQNAYQQLINAGYPDEQAQKMALISAQIIGQNLNNAGQTIQNQYSPAIQQAQLDQAAANIAQIPIDNKNKQDQLQAQKDQSAKDNAYRQSQASYQKEQDKLRNNNPTTPIEKTNPPTSAQITNYNEMIKADSEFYNIYHNQKLGKDGTYINAGSKSVSETHSKMWNYIYEQFGAGNLTMSQADALVSKYKIGR